MKSSGMKILLIHPAAQMSVSDVMRGYRGALTRAGHEVVDYWYGQRMNYHHRALPEGIRDNQQILARQASETILNEALYNDVDLVLVVSGLNVHPIFLWLLKKVEIPAAVILTESPYDDEAQAEWTDLTKAGTDADLTVFTNDRYSANQYGWNFLPPSFDPAFHKPVDMVEDDACDVVMVGTGWPERQALLECINWSGIKLRLLGLWPGLENNPNSPIYKFYRPSIVDNSNIASIYCSAKVCININRRSEVALTPGPRTFELAACGAFQITDGRADTSSIFGDSVPVFTDATSMEMMIRYYIDHPEERARRAAEALSKVQPHTFDNRVANMVAALQSQVLVSR